MKKIILLTLLLILIASSATWAQGNPFAAKSSRQSQKPNFLTTLTIRVSAPLVPLQKKLNSSISRLTWKLKKAPSPATLLFIIFASFLYGMVHALGPGHSKIIVSSYLLSKEAKIIQGVILGNLIAFIHAGTALALVLILSFVIKALFSSSFDLASRVIQLFSYALITLMGLWLFIMAIIKAQKKDVVSEAIVEEPLDAQSFLLVSLAAGIVPCPGAAAILLFTFSQDVLLVGVFSVIAMSVGMGVTISLVGVLTILAKQGVFAAFKLKSGREIKFPHMFFQFLGAISLFTIGLLLFLSRL